MVTQPPTVMRPPRRVFFLGFLGFAATMAMASSAVADDDAMTFRNLATSTDYRVRVLAALSLGKSKAAGARAALENALRDAHPAVRVAAGAALASLGDARAVKALRAALATEAEVNAKQQYEQSIQRLGQGAPSASGKSKFLVLLGKLENRTTTNTPAIASALKDLTRIRMGQVPGVELVPDGADVGAAGKSRGLPAFQIDGLLTQLNKKLDGGDVGYFARVEYMIRKMPDQALKGTVAGTSGAFAAERDVKGPREVTQLQIDAMTAAIDSALKGAAPALDTAGR